MFLPSQIALSPTASAKTPEPVEVQQAIVATTTPEVVKTVSPTCNCVNLLYKTFKHVPSVAEMKSQASKAMGNVVYMKDNGLDHFVVVESQGLGTFTYHEWGKFNGTCKDRRGTMSFADPRIKGYLTLE